MSKLAKFRGEALKAHNSYREMHGVPQLEYDVELESSAQVYAEELLEADELRVSHGASLGIYGENISRRSSSTKSKPDISGAEVTSLWYRDIEKFNYAKGTGRAGNFTQLVWRDTRLFGIGKANAHGKVVVVAHYGPAGNVRGQFLDNVPPPLPAAAAAATADDSTQLKRGASKDSEADNEMLNYRVRAREVDTKEMREGRAAVVVRRELVEYEDAEGRTKKKLVEERHPKPSRAEEEGSSSTGTSPSSSDGADAEENEEAAAPADKAEPPASPESSEVPKEAATRDSQETHGSHTQKVRQTVKRNPAELQKFAKHVTAAVNAYRKRHDARPLRLSTELSEMAQQLSEEQAVSAEKLRISSGTSYRGQRLGQSLAARVSGVNTAASADHVVGLWYGEGKQYNFHEEPADIEACGNFTQLVWKASQDIGVGKCTAQLADGSYKLVVVCYYFPTGNVSKEFLQNVLPPKK